MRIAAKRCIPVFRKVHAWISGYQTSFADDSWMALTMSVCTTVGDGFIPQAMTDNLGVC